jgi:hypothetical protein
LNLLRISRAQYRLNFEPPPTTFQDLVPKKPSGRESMVLDRQPRRFPVGWFGLSLADPDWRGKHYARWSASRKAAGLPHIVHDQEVA